MEAIPPLDFEECNESQQPHHILPKNELFNFISKIRI